MCVLLFFPFKSLSCLLLSQRAQINNFMNNPFYLAYLCLGVASSLTRQHISCGTISCKNAWQGEIKIVYQNKAILVIVIVVVGVRLWKASLSSIIKYQDSFITAPEMANLPLEFVVHAWNSSFNPARNWQWVFLLLSIFKPLSTLIGLSPVGPRLPAFLY